MASTTNEDTCRICYQTQDTLFPIFWKRKDQTPYDILIKNTSLKIDINDGGPSSICSQCLNELDTTVSFLNKCERSNEIFASMVIVDQCEFKTSEVFESLEKVQDDIMKSVPQLTAKCTQCDKVYCGSTNGCVHVKSHSAHTCQYCGKVFTRKFNYRLHIKRHLGEREWPCPTCGVSQLTQWLAQKHCTPRPRRTCPVPGCGKTFTTNTNLNTHIRVHKGERPHSCTECGKSFYCKNTLNDHMRIHTGAKPYICPVCGKRFRTNKLSAHMWTHETGARHACSVAGCKRAFRSPRSLAHHVATQHSARAQTAFSCAHCPALYAHKQSLNKHLRKRHAQTHSAEDGKVDLENDPNAHVG